MKRICSNLGVRCIETDVERRSVNPFTDLKLFHTYKTILKKEKPDLVLTYSIKPNIYAGYLCGKMKIPFYANVQGLGTAFQKPVLSGYCYANVSNCISESRKSLFRKSGRMQRSSESAKILQEEQEVILNGAGINLEEYRYCLYPDNDKIHFLYLGRIMREKGIDELFEAAERLRKRRH